MTTNAIETQGALREDGTLVLDEKPNLPPGRVKVILEAAKPDKSAANDVIAVLDRIHAAQRERGYVPPSAEEIEAYIREMRDDDERCRMIEQIQEECRLQRERQQQSEAG